MRKKLLLLFALTLGSQSLFAETYNFNFYNNDQVQTSNSVPETTNNVDLEKKNEPIAPATDPTVPLIQSQLPKEKTFLDKQWRIGLFDSFKNYSLVQDVTDGQSDQANRYLLKLSFGRPGGIIFSPFVGMGNYQRTIIYDSSSDSLNFKSQGLGLEIKKEFLIMDYLGFSLGVGASYFSNKLNEDNTNFSSASDYRLTVNQTSGYLLSGIDFYLDPMAIELSVNWGQDQSKLSWQEYDTTYSPSSRADSFKFKENFTQISIGASYLF